VIFADFFEVKPIPLREFCKD